MYRRGIEPGTRLKTSRTSVATALAALALTAQAHAVEPVRISNIRAEGLQRLEIGTVLTDLPLSNGDTLNDSTSQQAIRSLYGSGLFQDVQLERDGDTLIVKLQERPEIGRAHV